MFNSRANKLPQSVNKSEWSLLDLDSSDSSASDGLGKVIFSVLFEVISILELEGLVTESASDGLELVICSSVLLYWKFYLQKVQMIA